MPVRTPAHDCTDRRIGRLFAHQDGVASRAQLTELGLPATTLDARVSRGRYVRIHHGVYKEGHAPLSRRGQMRAAVLAAGPEAVLSGESVLELLRIRPPGSGPIHVATLRRTRCQRGVRVHQTRSLHRRDVTRRNGIPMMTAARALCEVGLRADEHRLGRDIHEALYRGAISERSVAEVCQRLRNSPGASRFRRAWIAYQAGSAGTWSELERAFVALLIEADIPVPPLNVRIQLPGGSEIRVDGDWAEYGFVHEVNGAGHLRPRTKRDDRSRRILLAKIGRDVVDIDAYEIQFRPDAVVRRIRDELDRRTTAR